MSSVNLTLEADIYVYIYVEIKMSASKQMLVHINLIYFNIEMQLTSENPFRHF